MTDHEAVAALQLGADPRLAVGAVGGVVHLADQVGQVRVPDGSRGRRRFPGVLDHDAGRLRDALDEVIPVAGTMPDITARVIPGHLGDAAAVIDGQDQISRCRRRTRQDRFGEYVSGHVRCLPRTTLAGADRLSPSR